MDQYLEALKYVRDNGEVRPDRTGVGTTSVFGYQMRFDLGEGFPLLTTKKIHLKSVIHELLWFIQGSTNIQYLKRKIKVRIWDEWADEYGELGPVYGKQWRAWESFDPIMSFRGIDPGWEEHVESIDQLQQVIDDIKTNPYSRRHIVSAWNVADLPQMHLPPCHLLFQFYVSTNNKLSCHLYQRSADIFLGVPFNIASYALLTQMIAKVCDLELGHFVHTFGDLHIYNNHFEQVEEQLSRKPRDLPIMIIHGDQQNINDFKYEDFELTEYDPYPVIKAQVAV